MQTNIVKKQNKGKIDKATIELVDEILDNKRAEKGIEIAQNAGVTEMIDQVRFYKVGSQSDPNRQYTVREIFENKKTSFACNCKDYENFFIKGEQKHECKHIIAVQFAKHYDLALTEVKDSNWRNDLYDF